MYLNSEWFNSEFNSMSSLGLWIELSWVLLPQRLMFSSNMEANGFHFVIVSAWIFKNLLKSKGEQFPSASLLIHLSKWTKSKEGVTQLEAVGRFQFFVFILQYFHIKIFLSHDVKWWLKVKTLWNQATEEFFFLRHLILFRIVEIKSFLLRWLFQITEYSNIWRRVSC